MASNGGAEVGTTVPVEEEKEEEEEEEEEGGAGERDKQDEDVCSDQELEDLLNCEPSALSTFPCPHSLIHTCCGHQA